jgi:DNA polymerase, archaea type
MDGIFLDISAKTIEEKSKIELTFKKGNKHIKLIDEHFKPYFYLILKNEKEIKKIDLSKYNIKEIKIDTKKKNKLQIKKFTNAKLSNEELEKEEYTIVKLLFEKIQDLIQCKREIIDEEYFAGKFEYDIPFDLRYCLDKNIKSLHSYEIEETENGLKFKENENEENFKTLAFDIETYSKRPNMGKDPIILISIYGINNGKEFKKVISSKEPTKKEEYVIVKENEKELIEEFLNIIEKENPDFLLTYNGDGFDLPCLQKRAKANKINEKFDSILKFRPHSFAGFTVCYTKGIQHIDVYKIILKLANMGAINLQHFKLNDVYKFLFNKTKIDLPYDKMIEHYDDPNKLDIFIEYNLVDSKATFEIAERFLAQFIQLSQITGLSIQRACRASASMLVEPTLMYRTQQANKIIPNIPRGETINARSQERYEGGFVKQPKIGLHENIAIVDFSSLYPSVIIANNISPETLNVKCSRIIESPTGDLFSTKDAATIPTMLENLLSERKEIKNRLRIETNETEKRTLHAQQWSLKILANSTYGYLGFEKARWYSLECARSIAAFSQKAIKEVIEKAELFGFEVLYGDSLPPDRKIFIKDPKGNIKLEEIGTFVDKNINNKNINKYKTLSYKNNNIIYSPILKGIRHQYNSEKGKLLEFDTTNGKTIVTPQHSIYKFDRQIKLEDAKKLKIGDYLISFNTIPVSEKIKENYIFDITTLDLKEYNDKLYLYPDLLKFLAKKDKEKCPYCKKMRILYSHVSLQHRNLVTPMSKSKLCKYKYIGGKNKHIGRIPRFWKLDKNLAWLMGYFAADGSASEKSKIHNKTMISFGSQNLKTIQKVKKILDKILKTDLKIIENFDKRINKTMYYYRAQRLPLVPLFIYGFDLGKESHGKKVPWFIFNAEEKLKLAFLDGYIEGDGLKSQDPRYKTLFQKFSTKSKNLAIGLQYLLKSLKNKDRNYFGKKICNIYWGYRKDKKDIIDLRHQSVKASEYDNFCISKIRNIKKINYSGYVYDLEVKDAHNFLDAEGLILVHNTDSAFLQYKKKEDVLSFLKQTNATLQDPMELSLENFYKRGLFVTKKQGKGSAKKRYAMMDDNGKMKIVGFEYVRRDWCMLARNLQKEILDILLKTKDNKKALELVQKTIKDLENKNIKMEDLVLSNRIRKPLELYSSTGPHVAAAIKANKLGAKFNIGSNIEYIITAGKGSISEKAEMKDLVDKGNYDIEYYIHNQILPVVVSIFEVFGISEDQILGNPTQKKLFDSF